jgi:hypothetical protein
VTLDEGFIQDEDYFQDGGFHGWLRLAMPSSTFEPGSMPPVFRISRTGGNRGVKSRRASPVRGNRIRFPLMLRPRCF